MRLLLTVLVFAGLLLGGASGAGAAGQDETPTVDTGEVEALQGRMLADPQVMALIIALQSDPEVQALLSDPKVLEAVQAGDLGALMQHPSVRALLANPKVREIERQLGK